MNLIKFIEILSSKMLYLVILPIITGTFTYFMVKDLPKTYSTETTIYTGITTNTGLDVADRRVDKYVNQNEYNNILSLFKSESIFKEISLRLLASHLILTQPQKEIISKASFDILQEKVPAEVRKLVVKGNLERTYENLNKSVKEDEKDYLYSILNHSNPHYSISALRTLKVEQVSSSDMIRLSYQCDDPGICFNTARIASEVFIEKYGILKKNIKSSAVKYFQKKLEEITSRLDDSENRLLDFNISNKIINYYEQTKQVTTQNEEIELKLQDAKMSFEATTAVLKKLESEIAKRFAINIKNVEILNIRGQLVECNNTLAQSEINQKTSELNIQQLTARKKMLEQKMASKLDSIYHFESNSQGIEYQRLLGEWLTAVNNYETYGARYKSMEERRIEFMKEFQRYAPLGATSKRIEREIDVREREYMNILNNLNIALQNEQNIDLLSNMHIIDPAAFPITAQPSKKNLYVTIAVLFTLIFYITGLFVLELMDKRVKTPMLLKQLTQWDVLGAFCIHNNKKFINTEQITQKAVLFIYEKIRSLSINHKKPFTIQILSNWDGAGKAFTAHIIHEELNRRGYKVQNLNFMEAVSSTNESNQPETIAAKERMEQFLRANNYEEFMGDSSEPLDYLIITFPSIGRGIDNTVLLQDGDLNLVVFNACLTWGVADEYNTNKIKELIHTDIYSILTNAQPNNLEELYGEIPKKRSKFRIMIKNILKRFTQR